MAWESLLDQFNQTGVIPKNVEVVERGSEVPHVRCCCGRVCPADMMVKLEGEWCCDGCVSRYQREHGYTRREMADVVGGSREESPCCNRPYAGGRKALDVEREHG